DRGECRVLGMATDVADEVAAEKLVRRGPPGVGGGEILLHNTRAHPRGAVVTTTAEHVERQVAEEEVGLFFFFWAMLPIMRKQKGGRIINIVGQAARHPHPDRFPSGVTNAACMALTKSVADAVARDNIRVNAVCPQYIESELLTSLIEKEMRERKVDRA